MAPSRQITETYANLLDGMQAHLTETVQHYAKSAPVVSGWADDLYIRINEDRGSVTLEDLYHAQRLRLPADDPRDWMDGAYAANFITKLLYTQGRDTTGLLYE